MNIKSNRIIKSVLYGFHVIFHPFDGFYDLKHEKKGGMAGANIILFLTVLSVIVNKQYAGYFASSYDPYTCNVVTEILTRITAFVLFVAANWCFTTLMDGEGTMRDIYIATAYALLPIILILIPLTAVSNVLSLGDIAYYNFIYSAAVIWVGLLIFAGNMVTHQYTLLKTVAMVVLTVAGMLVIIFIFLLFFSLIQKIYVVIIEAYKELTFRLY